MARLLVVTKALLPERGLKLYAISGTCKVAIVTKALLPERGLKRRVV